MSEFGYVYVGATRWRGGTLSGVYRSSIGGDGWQECNSGLPEDIHVQFVLVHPETPEVLFAGTSDGPYRSTNRGNHWQRMNFPERNRQIWSLHIDPTNTKRVFAGASPVEVFLSEDSGENWRFLPGSNIPPKFDTGKFVNRVMRLNVDPSRSSTIFGVSEVNGAMRSLDGGNSWEDCNAALVELVKAHPELESAILTTSRFEGIFDMHAGCISSAAPDTFFFACRMGLFTSSDRGNTWRDLGISKFSDFSYGRDIKVSPHNPRHLYACVSVSSHGKTGALYRSLDLGESWTRFDHSLTTEGTMMSLALHPETAGVVLAASRSGQVFETLDDGKSWKTRLLPEGCEGVYSIACGS